MKCLEDGRWVSHWEATGVGSLGTQDTMLELASSHRWDGYLILRMWDNKLYISCRFGQTLDESGIRMDT